MNEVAKHLINELRNNPLMAKQFDMGSWTDEDVYPDTPREYCGTIGCIAGAVIFLYDREFYHRRAPASDPLGGAPFILRALELLEIENLHVANYLFMPDYWKNDVLLAARQDLEHYFSIGTNSGATWKTVADMKQWAKRVGLANPLRSLYPYIGHLEAADAIEFTLDRHPGYVDWKEVLEEKI